MARLSSDFGNFSGKVGNIVLRTRNGKTYAASLPVEYTVSYSENAVKAREQFALMAKLSKAISDNFTLNHFWRISGYPGESVRNKIQKRYKGVKLNNDLSAFQLFESEDLFQISVKAINIDNTISIIINPISETCPQEISRLKNPLISAQGCIFLCNPESPTFKEKLVFTTIASPDISSSFDEEITFNIKLSGMLLKKMLKSPGIKLLFNLALKESAGRPTRCSNTKYCAIR